MKTVAIVQARMGSSRLPGKVMRFVGRHRVIDLLLHRLAHAREIDEIAPLAHRKIFEALRAKDIMVNLRYFPVHTQPFYQKMGLDWGCFPEAEQFYKEAISIPMHPSLTDAEQDFVVASFREALGR